MSGQFFKANGVDEDKVAECVGDIDSLIDAVNNWRDEVEAYSNELCSAKSDLEDAEDRADIDEVVSALQSISLPDGADTMDTTPESLSDALEDCTAEQSPYEEWEGNMTRLLKSLSEFIVVLPETLTIDPRNELYRRFAQLRSEFERGTRKINESVGVSR